MEWEAGWLAGYENSRPVRDWQRRLIQLQLDIYGEMLDCFFHAQHSMPSAMAKTISACSRCCSNIWRPSGSSPDEGIWETRGGPQQFTYSKMMAWVAFDRAVLLAEQLGYDGSARKVDAIRDAIHSEICAKGFNTEKDSFTQAYGSKQLDASLLLMPVRSASCRAADPRVRGPRSRRSSAS